MMVKKTPYDRDPELETKYPHLKEFFPFLHDLRSESERGGVLLCCAYLDDLLRDMLLAFFMPGPEAKKLIGGFNAPLGSFSARIAAAYSCGLLLEEEHRELTTLRKIRNEFAHSKTVSFDDQKISDLCSSLIYKVPETPDKPAVTAIAKFNSAAVLLISNLVNRAHYVPRQKRPTSWPR